MSSNLPMPSIQDFLSQYRDMIKHLMDKVRKVLHGLVDSIRRSYKPNRMGHTHHPYHQAFVHKRVKGSRTSYFQVRSRA